MTGHSEGPSPNHSLLYLGHLSIQRQAQADWEEKNNKRELKINEFGGIYINGNWEECKVISRGREMTVVRVARLIDGQPGWRDCGCINDCVTELAPSLIGRKSVFGKRGVEELRIKCPGVKLKSARVYSSPLTPTFTQV